MTQEDKDILKKVLCEQLPYGVKVWSSNGTGAISFITGMVNDICYFEDEPSYGNRCPIKKVKPYLRPMDSMTEEEKEEYDKTFDWNYSIQGTPFDWLNEHHFDYRGLIEKGLALEAPEGMYKTE